MIKGLDVGIIAATDLAGGIGEDGGIPWHVPDDLRNFKEETKGNIVVMGRKTYTDIVERLGNGVGGEHVLPNRRCVVLSKTLSYEEVKDAILIRDIKELIHGDIITDEDWENNKVIFFAGGRQIYDLGMEYADFAIITEMKDVFDCDVQFNYNKFHKLFQDYKYLNKVGKSNGINYEINYYGKKSQVKGWKDEDSKN